MTGTFRRVMIASGLAMAAVPLSFRRIDVGSAYSAVATVPVVVARREVAAGQVFDQTALMLTKWPVGTAPAGKFGRADSLIGRTARTRVYRGEPIVEGSLALTATPGGFELPVVAGHRAYGVRVDDIATVSGFVRPNSRVDIMVVTTDRNGSRPIAKLLVANVRVIAIDAPSVRGPRARPGRGRAVVEVTADQVIVLAVAQERGALQFVLRGPAPASSPSGTGADP